MIIGRKPSAIFLLGMFLLCMQSLACYGLAPTPPPQGMTDHTSAITILANTTKPAQLPALMCQVKARAGALNLRKCGGMNCPVLASLAEGETVTQAGAQIVDDWLEVRTRAGLTGWVSAVHVICK